MNRSLDAMILRPESSPAEVRNVIREMLELSPRMVCVRPCDIAVAKSLVQESDVGVCVVLGFPHGSQLPASKVEEARLYVNLGVDEIEMVVSTGNVRGHAWKAVADELGAVVAVTKPMGVLLKVVAETSLLRPEESIRLTGTCAEAGVDFIVTSTGCDKAGESDESIRAMVSAASGRLQVKVSGGIQDRARAEHLLALGATRLGVDPSVAAAIVNASFCANNFAGGK